MWFDKQPLWLKIVLLVLLGPIVSGVYRILTWNKSKNAVTLVIGVLSFFGLGFLLMIVDIITEVTSGKISVLCD